MKEAVKGCDCEISCDRCVVVKKAVKVCDCEGS